MHATTRTSVRLLVAAPLAALALGVGAGAAHAGDNGGDLPFQVSPGVVDPKGPGDIASPKPEEDPKPQGPGDITNPEHDEDPKPQGPGDIANPDEDDEPGPQIPGDKDGPNPGDGPDLPGPGDVAIPEGGDEPGDKPVDTPADRPGENAPEKKQAPDETAQSPEVDQDVADVPVPERIDAGAGPVQDDGGLALAWLLAGGGLATAAGSLLVRQRVARRTR